MSKHKYEVDIGRAILRDGEIVARLVRVAEPGLSPSATDDLVQRIVTLLNEHGDGLRAPKRKTR